LNKTEVIYRWQSACGICRNRKEEEEQEEEEQQEEQEEKSLAYCHY